MSVQNVIAGFVISTSLIACPFSVQPPNNSIASFVEKVESGSTEGDFDLIYTMYEQTGVINTPLVNDAISMIGEVDDLTEEEERIYHENIIKHATFIGGSYFD